MNQIKFKIIIVNYNGVLDTLECLESLLKSSYQDFQIFVVDNSINESDFDVSKQWSTNSFIEIKTNFPTIIYPLFEKDSSDISFFLEDDFALQSNLNHKIIFIKANENKGFSAANNIVLKYLQKQEEFHFLWLLNNDTVVPLDFLETINEKLKNISPGVGIIGNALCYYDNPKVLQCLANKCNKWLAHTFPVYEGALYEEVLMKINNKPLEYFSPVGASMFIKYECFKEVGLLEEEYFLYFEEWDYTIRSKKKSWKSIIFADVFIYHKHGTTIDEGNKDRATKTIFSDYFLLKNKLVFARKNLQFYYFPTIYLSYIPVILNRLKRKQWKRIIMVLKIIWGK
jgi:GT2 family glycosyltransferase